MNCTPNQLVRCHQQIAAVVARYPDDAWVPEDHLALWYGEVNEQGYPVVWTVPSDCCQALQLPLEVRH